MCLSPHAGALKGICTYVYVLIIYLLSFIRFNPYDKGMFGGMARYITVFFYSKNNFF